MRDPTLTNTGLLHFLLVSLKWLQICLNARKNVPQFASSLELWRHLQRTWNWQAISMISFCSLQILNCNLGIIDADFLLSLRILFSMDYFESFPFFRDLLHPPKNTPKGRKRRVGFKKMQKIYQEDKNNILLIWNAKLHLFIYKNNLISVMEGK